ncbi:MAG TPA: hypothetical protein VJS18_21150 [Paraburkholderia sp.]|nr:hypothetical protein [Paraburkholderia sp.]
MNGAPRVEPDAEVVRPPLNSSDAPIAATDALIVFVASPPASADRLVVTAVSPSSVETLQDRTLSECKREPHLVAEQIAVACERWAQVERRLVRFRAAWLRGDKPCATHTWQVGANEEDPHVLDGSVMSVLLQLQKVFESQSVAITNERKLALESQEMVQSSWDRLFQVQNTRIAALEKDNDGLRDRLRKMDDVGTEIALESMRSDIEQRGRSADLIEKRLLPIMQVYMSQKMQEAGLTPSAAPVTGNSHQEKRG